MRRCEYLENELKSLGFVESFQKYRMCDPRWSPEKSVLHHMEGGDARVSQSGVNLLVRYLRQIGVRGGKMEFSEVMKSLDCTTAGGFGTSTTVKHKSGLVLNLDDVDMDDYEEWYKKLPERVKVDDLPPEMIVFMFITFLKIKEEVSKSTKIDIGDYRTFFCTPFVQLVLSKMSEEVFNQSLTKCGFLFKGEDMRSSIRELYATAKKEQALQSDATLLDRSIFRGLLSQVQDIRKTFGSTMSKGMRFAILNPVVAYVDEIGVVWLVKFQRPQVSGRDSTTEDDFLVLALVLCELFVNLDIPCGDFYLVGVGDDMTAYVSPRFRDKVTVALIIEHFARFNITQKCWQVLTMQDFKFLGAGIVESVDGPQPVWDLERSVVRLAYRDRKEKTFTYLQRVLGVYAYNVYHPKVHLLIAHFQKCFERWSKFLSASEMATLRRIVDEIPGFYWRPQCRATAKGGPNSNIMAMSVKRSAGIPSERVALKTLKNCSSTLEGAQWLEQSLDPFHDRELPHVGMPDSEKGLSVIKTITKRFSVGNGNTGGNTWDAQLMICRELQSASGFASSVQPNFPDETLTNQPAPFIDVSGATLGRDGGGVTVHTGASAADLRMGLSYGAFYAVVPFGNVLSNSAQPMITKNGYRVVGGGVEIHDTTPELYRSGFITISDLPNQNDSIDCVAIGVSPSAAPYDEGVDVVYDERVEPNMFANLAAAQNQPNTVEWRMSEGAYIPFRLDVDKGVHYAKHEGFVYWNSSDVDGKCFVAADSKFDGGWGTRATWSLPSNIQPLTAYLTGLDPHVTFDVIVKWIIEEFPNPGDGSLMPLSRPSIAQDNEALQAYKRIVSELPLGVPVSENGFGDFFRGVLRVAKSIASPIYEAVKPALMAHPIGRAVVAGVEGTKAAAKSMKRSTAAAKGKKK